jgi:neopullulanase
VTFAAPDPWTPRWVRDAVFYQIFPDRFARSGRVPAPGPLEPWDAPPTHHGFKGGDLYGIAEHLDHIQALGASAIYLNPIFQSASNHRYHTYDYLAVDPLLGGNAALRELIDACHRRGMRIVLDGVFNHTGRGFWAFHHVLENGVASPYVDWFFFDRSALQRGAVPRAYGEHPVAGVDAFDRFGYRAWWGLPALPKLNVDEPNVRAMLLDVAEHWLRFGADGWRLDVPEEMPDDFWREFRTRVKTVDPDAYIVGEIWHEAPDALRGDRFDAVMDYPLAAAILSFVGAGRLDHRVVAQQHTLAVTVRDEDATAFAARLEQAMTVYEPAVTAVQLNLLGSHDTPRLLSMVSGDVGAVQLAILLLMTLPGAPSIYYGDEIGLTGEHDPANRAAFPWDRPEGWNQALLGWITGAAALRQTHPVLRGGDLRIAFADGPTIAYLRRDDSEAALVVVHAGDAPRSVEVYAPGLAGRAVSPARWPGSGALAVPDEIDVDGDGRLNVDLAARGGVVLLTST